MHLSQHICASACVLVCGCVRAYLCAYVGVVVRASSELGQLVKVIRTRTRIVRLQSGDDVGGGWFSGTARPCAEATSAPSVAFGC